MKQLILHYELLLQTPLLLNLFSLFCQKYQHKILCLLEYFLIQP
ncbi:hypothetical protein MCHI_002711 [Candidatus Magnetoovum chiemensis]|nr:hypothetical protein MCHI_002711 [Candidatus Magnetoovum chiemensis]